jgi:hypothetical protein
MSSTINNDSEWCKNCINRCPWCENISIDAGLSTIGLFNEIDKPLVEIYPDETGGYEWHGGDIWSGYSEEDEDDNEDYSNQDHEEDR